MASLYQSSVPVLIKFLNNFALILDKAQAWAKENGKTEKDIIEDRLIADMFPFSGQVLIMLKMAASVALDIGEIPATEGIVTTYKLYDQLKQEWQTFADVRKSVEVTIDYLKSVPASAIDGKEDKEMTVAFFHREYTMKASTMIYEFVYSNFHFHYTTAYDILRVKGIDVGKADYVRDVCTNLAAVQSGKY